MPSRLPWYQVAWHALALPAVVLVPTLLAYGRPPRAVPPAHVPALVSLACAYLIAAIGLTALGRRTGRDVPGRVAPVVLGALVLFYLPLLLRPEPAYSRLLLLVGSGCLVALFPVPHVRRPAPALLLVPLTLAAGAAGVAALDPGAPSEPEGPAREVRVEYLNSAHHVVRAVRYSGFVVSGDPKSTIGGGVDDLPRSGGFLLARGDGVIHRLTWEGDSLSVTRAGFGVPLDRDAFAAAAGETVNLEWFRVADILVRDGVDSVTVLASHHVWKPDRACYAVRLVRRTVPAGALEGAEGIDGSWQTVHETRPCLPLKGRGRNTFAGQQMGGRLALLDERRVLMTVGDHEFDGYNSERVVSQETGSDYGRTLEIDLATGDVEVFALGQRNPQGLFVDRAGTVWSTEHGPEGGDELNRLVRGGNYGWPWRTYGTEYGGLAWPLADTAADGPYRPPLHAWVPSIGVSSLLAVEGPGFTAWRDDLVVASLRAGTLWRVRLDAGRVAFAEPIDVGSRIRDLTEDRDGSLVLWTDSAEVIRLEPADAREDGVALFQRYCGACHKLGGSEHAFAPDLTGVVGRPVASAEGFDYSAALARMGGTWTSDRLRAFLREPAAIAPGTTMAFPGVDDPDDLDALVRYLVTLDEPE